MADLTNYTPVKVKDLTELTQINETSYIVITDGTSTKKIKAILLKGQDGVTPVFQIGSVSTLVEGSNATVNMTNVGGVYTINFGIPRGQSGSGGTSSGMTDTQLNQLSIAYGHSQTTHVQPSDIPTKTSQLTNNSGFATETYVTNAINNAQLSSGLTSTQEQQLNTAYTHSQSPHVKSSDIPTKVSSLENDSSFVTSSEMRAAINEAQLGGGSTDIDLSIYQLIQDNTLTTTAKTIPTAINELKRGLDGITVPTRTGQLTNDSGFITAIPEEYITETELNAKGYLTSHQDISNLQNKTDNSLTTTNKTVIGAINELKSGLNGIKVPTKTSELTNNSGFITAIPSEYITESELNAKGYLTSHQDISSLQNKTDNSLVTTNKTVIGAINELKGIIDTLQSRITALENQQSTTTRVTGVSLNNSSLTLNIGDTNTLIATVLPTNATNKSVTWSTNNSSVASVNNGTVTAHAKGQATIRVTTADGGYSASCVVTVNEVSTTVSVTGVTLSTNTLSIKTGETANLTANIRPSNATNKNVTWSTNNNAVASVNNGVVTANSVGQATIRVITEDGNYSDSCIVTVSQTVTTVSVTGVTLNSHALTMNKIGGTQTLGYTITPSNATNQNVTWSTSVPTVASINNGIITANANGTTVITIRTTDGGYTDTCTVTVNDTSQTGGGGDSTLYIPDIASYGISKEGTNSEATTNGLNRLFTDLNTSGKTNVQLPTGTYAINPDISLTPKSNLTLDLNGSKLKIDTNGKNGSTMIYLKEVENLTLKNGTIEGDRYTHDYSTYNENTTSHEFNVGIKIDQGSRNINIDNVKFTKITGYGLATFQGAQYCNVALDKTKMESGDYNDSGSKVADATKIRYPQAVNITEHAALGYLQVGTLLKYQNYVFNSTRMVTVRMFNASGSLLSKVTSKMYRPIAVPSNATTAYLTFHQSNPSDYLAGDLYTLDVFHMKPPRDCNITNCTFDDNRCLGVAICGGWNIKIEGNTFKNTSKPTSDTSSPNYQHGKPGYGIDIEDGWESTQDLTIHNNVFTNNGYGDIVSLAGDNTVITQNQFSGRVAMYSRNTNYIVQHNTIANGIAMFETEKDYGFKVDHNTYTDTTIKAKCHKPLDIDYYSFTNETITNGQMQLDTSITLKNSTITLSGATNSRFTGSYDTCTIKNFDGSDSNSDYNTGIKLNNCDVSNSNFFPSKDTIMTNNTFNKFRVRLDGSTLVFTGNEIQSNPKNATMPIVQLNGGTKATIKNNTLNPAVTVSLYRNDAKIEVITDDSGSGESG